MRSFSEILPEIANGFTDAQLTEQLSAVVHGVSTTLNNGRLTLDLTIKPAGDGQFTVVPVVKSKVPELTRSSTFWGTPEGSLEMQETESFDESRVTSINRRNEL